MKTWQGNLLACKQGKISDRHGSWSFGNKDVMLKSHGFLEKINVPKGRVLENEKTSWDWRVTSGESGEDGDKDRYCPPS